MFLQDARINLVKLLAKMSKFIAVPKHKINILKNFVVLSQKWTNILKQACMKVLMPERS